MATTHPSDRRWPTYALVWRWHFYAGLFCLPFVLWLSVTGSIYLFKPQIEGLIDRPYAHVAGDGPRTDAAGQVAAAIAAVPGSVLHRYQLPDTPEQAVQIVVGRARTEMRVYVHPQTLRVLKIVDEDSRLMRIVFRLHGELLAGDWGSYLVELAASWTIVMILSGLYLWWPSGRALAGVIYPRVSAGGRRFWRDLHAVTGIWISCFALLFLVSGLPWAKSWGSYLKLVRTAVERRPVAQDWSTGHASEVRARVAADAGTRAMLDEHADHRGMTMGHPATDYAPLDRLVRAVGPLHLAGPVLIAPPTGPAQPWTAKSDASDRPLRTDLTLDGATGRILSRADFAQRRLIDRLVGYGVAFHEGALFGWLNQVLNLLVAAGLMLLVISGTVMWWRRRPIGKLAAPRAKPQHLAVGFFALLGLLAITLPLFGASLAAVILLDRAIGTALHLKTTKQAIT